MSLAPSGPLPKRRKRRIRRRRGYLRGQQAPKEPMTYARLQVIRLGFEPKDWNMRDEAGI